MLCFQVVLQGFSFQNLQGKRPGNKVVIFEYSLSGLEPVARFHKALLSIVFVFFFLTKANVNITEGYCF